MAEDARLILSAVAVIVLLGFQTFLANRRG